MEPSQSMVVATPRNPLVQVQARVKDLEMRFQSWVKKQPAYLEAAVATTTGAVQGAAIGYLLGTLTPDMSATFPVPPPQTGGLGPGAMAPLRQAQALAGGPLVQARNVAVITGANAGILTLMKRIRGVDDVQNSMVAAFGSGALFSLVSGMGGTNQVAGAISSGVAFALIQGGVFKVGQMFSKPSVPTENPFYSRTRSMLTSLGLQKYEKNFQKGLLTDSTLPLLTDSALRDVSIPPGPRLLILDRVQRDPELAAGKQ